MKTSDITSAWVRCAYAGPLGAMTLAASDQGLSGCWFDGQKHMPDVSRWTVQNDNPVLQRAASELQRYFAGEAHPFQVPLDIQVGTAFQQSVWRALLGIAPGQTLSYGELSQRLGRATAVRAVGAAVGRNPLSLFIPCHRVVGANGALTGYAGGLERKHALLELEHGQASRFAQGTIAG